MASTSNIHNCSVGIVNQGGNVQIDNFNMHVNNPQPDVNESDFDLPRLIDTFHGREEEFSTLKKLFFSQKKNKIVVYGLPGYGKTELCKQFAQRCLDVKIMDRVFWIKAENIDELGKYSACLNTIYKKYENLHCFFVFDNALNRRSISDYEPSKNDKHKMLVTSHVKDWGHGVVSLPLGPLTSEPVTKIFKTILEKYYREEHHSSYLELGQTVDNVPLGVQIVAGYVRQEILSLGQSFQLINYVEEMKQSKHTIMHDTFSESNPNSYNNSIYDALTISLNKMKEEKKDTKRRELAVTVLYVCAFVDPDWIRCDDLIKIPLIKELIGDINSKVSLKSAISLLVNFSFLNYLDTKKNKFNIHRLVQSYLRQYLSSCHLEDTKRYSACVHAMFDYVSSVLKYADVSTEQECVEFLMKVFQDLNGSGTDMIYANDMFYKAADWNRIKVLELLLQQADINKTNYNCHKVMYSVARSFNAKAVELLIEHGVDVNSRDAANRTPMDSLLFKLTGGDRFFSPRNIIMSTLAVMLERSALFDQNVLYEDKQFWLLSSAASQNKLDVLKSLIQQGLDVNSRSRTYWCDDNSVLHEAVIGGNFESIQILISHGADANAVNDIHETALVRFVRYVITSNRNIDKQKLREILVALNCKEQAHNTNIYGRSILHLAAEGAHEELVTELLENYNCEVNKQDNGGQSPLHCLLLYLNKDSNKEEVVQTVRTLIRCGASLSIQNHEQQTPLQALKDRSKEEEYNIENLVPLLTPACTLL